MLLRIEGFDQRMMKFWFPVNNGSVLLQLMLSSPKAQAEQATQLTENNSALIQLVTKRAFGAAVVRRHSTPARRTAYALDRCESVKITSKPAPAAMAED